LKRIGTNAAVYLFKIGFQGSCNWRLETCECGSSGDLVFPSYSINGSEGKSRATLVGMGRPHITSFGALPPEQLLAYL